MLIHTLRTLVRSETMRRQDDYSYNKLRRRVYHPGGASLPRDARGAVESHFEAM